MTWDFALDDPVDATDVSAYIAEAVARYPEYKANQKEILGPGAFRDSVWRTPAPHAELGAE